VRRHHLMLDGIRNFTTLALVACTLVLQTSSDSQEVKPDKLSELMETAIVKKLTRVSPV
jgi:hypothetical protein